MLEALALGRALLAFIGKHWKTAAVASLALALALAMHVARLRGQEAAAARKQAADAAASAVAWKGAYDQQALLAKATTEAHAAETTALINTQRAVGSAKEGAAHAPGADDRFAYSDAAYGFLRAPRAAPAGSAAAPPPSVVGK
jgi:hypothetical protein